MQTFSEHTIFITLLWGCFTEKQISTPYQPHMQHIWRSIFVYIEKVFDFEKLFGYSNSFLYILHKIGMEKWWKIFFGYIFFGASTVQMVLKDVLMQQL